MTPERWQEIRDVLEKALELAPGERSAFLEQVCSSDPSLRQEVETLLASGPDVGSSFLQSSPLRVTLTSGTKLGEYEVKSLLGSGGMGEVYRARDSRLGRDVAIKVLPSFLCTDSERLRRFEQEARAAAALNHPNILAVFQMGTYEGAPYLVSELLEGETLRGQMKRGRLSIRKAIDYGVQIARGLAAAHEKGIVHRDLKPENLFITKDGRVKILDFGLAKLTQPQSSSKYSALTFTEGTEAGVVMGTVGYMSPEQVRGQRADHRADIFAFGAILYEMLAGKRAFQKPTSPETMTAIMNEDPPSISQVATDIPPSMQRVVHRCLEKNPEQRFQSASDLAFALDALSESGGSAYSATAAKAATGAGNRWKAIAPAAVGGFGLVLIASLIYFHSRPLPPPKVSGYVPVTHSGSQKDLVGTDGARLYFNEYAPAGLDIAQVSGTGGEVARVPVPAPSMGLLAVSPDGAALLVAPVFNKRHPMVSVRRAHLVLGANEVGPLWVVPVLGGSARRLVEGRAGAWSPDGQMIVYANGDDLFLTKSDSAEPRKLVSTPGRTFAPAWSPDGTVIRFSVGDYAITQSSLWQVSINGANLHPLFPAWHAHPDECCGKWTADGKYFVFQSRGNIWALAEKENLFGKANGQPLQLTSGPVTFSSPLPSKDGKKLFVVGALARGELTRYQAKSADFVPFFPESRRIALASLKMGSGWPM
jgi:hypothetical protein